MHHGAVMEGSWGGEATLVADADAALALLRAELEAGDVVLVSAPSGAGWDEMAAAVCADVGAPPALRGGPLARKADGRDTIA